MAEVWYNVAHLALGIGDVNLAYQVSWQDIKSDTNVINVFAVLQAVPDGQQ